MVKYWAMAERIHIIKTLPHLSKLYIPKNEISGYSYIYSIDIVNFLDNLQAFSLSDIKFSTLKKLLETQNYTRTETITDKLDFTVKGDIVTFWPIGYEHPVRIEFFGEEIERFYTIDELYNTKLYDQKFLILSNTIVEDKTERDSIQLNIPHNISSTKITKLITLSNLRDIANQDNFEIINLDFTLPQLFYSKFDLLKREIDTLKSNGYKVVIKTKNLNHLEDGLKKYINNFNDIVFKEDFYSNIIENLKEIDLPGGFISSTLKLAVLTDREIFGSIYLTRPEKTKKFSNNIKKLLRQFEGSIEIGDYVVHKDYGIGIYSGLTQEKIDGEELEYLLIKYAKEDELYVPLNQIEKITKYIGPEGVEPRITRLGRISWENVKDKIKKSTTLLAKELVEHYAKRQIASAKPILKQESKEYLEFVHDFKFRETEDQLRATNEILSDLESDKPMDRLLVGDVGFGKTEVIMRAAFKVVENGGQVAVLSPTTVLTSQHYEVFTERFKNFPISIGFVSRFKSAKENSETIDKVNEGKIDILIGTHRILGNDVKFKNLQLIVVDEEQRFGVAQKEKIKNLNYSAHLLSVSATPIPRTLSMALSSIQSLSIITTPPVNRKAINTQIIKDDWEKVSKAIVYEVQRGGQVYFLHNEVQTIQSIKKKLETLAPGIKYVIAHGQMSPTELDRIMTEFYMQKYDCLIATTIIENGLDIPSVNTMIINKAHRFGLSQLYQLRGRVGRSGEQAYCYLLYEGKDLLHFNLEETKSNKNPLYLERLQTLVDNQDLGAGFRIASRDLEIRGAGDLLGDQQSGHISTIGYALYIEILAEAIERLRSR